MDRREFERTPAFFFGLEVGVHHGKHTDAKRIGGIHREETALDYITGTRICFSCLKPRRRSPAFVYRAAPRHPLSSPWLTRSVLTWPGFIEEPTTPTPPLRSGGFGSGSSGLARTMKAPLRGSNEASLPTSLAPLAYDAGGIGFICSKSGLRPEKNRRREGRALSKLDGS